MIDIKLKTAILMLALLVFMGSQAKFSRAEVAPPKNPNSAKACAICHYRWIDTFYIEGKGTDFVPYTSEKLVATAEMCFSCHDGSVVDSRTIKHQLHKIGQPVKNVEIPDMFSLDERNGLYCGTCHTPHALPSGPDTDGPIFMRASIKNSEMCLLCHAGKKSVAGSFHDLQLTAAFEKNLNEKTTSETGPCSACHLQHSPPRDLYGRDDYSSGLCLSCHSKGKVAFATALTGVQHPSSLKPATHTSEQTLPLFNSYGNRSKDGMITCSTCHDPHQWRFGSSEKAVKGTTGDRTNSFLRKPAPEICVSCHPTMSNVINTRHDLNVSAPQALNIAGQLPDASGACGACHLVHNGKNETLLWARGLGEGNNFMEGVCNSCHTITGSAPAKIPEVYYHPREKLVEIKGRNIRSELKYFPIFNPKTGRPDNAGNISCPSCHNVHQSDRNHSSPEMVIITAIQAKNFLRPKEAFTICAECHKEKASEKIEKFHVFKLRIFRPFFFIKE